MRRSKQKPGGGATEGRWRRWFQGSGLVLSTIGGLITVLTAGWPVVNYLRTPRDAHLVASVQTGSDPSVIAVLLKNDGASPGTLGSAALTINNDHFPLAADGSLPQIVEPGETLVVRFTDAKEYDQFDEDPRNALRHLIQMPESFECGLELVQNDADGSVSTIELPLECGHAAAVLGVL